MSSSSLSPLFTEKTTKREILAFADAELREAELNYNAALANLRKTQMFAGQDPVGAMRASRTVVYAMKRVAIIAKKSTELRREW